MTDIYLNCRCAHNRLYDETHSYAECDGGVHVQRRVSEMLGMRDEAKRARDFEVFLPLPWGGGGQFVPPTMHDCNFTYNSYIICARTRHRLSSTVQEGD